MLKSLSLFALASLIFGALVSAQATNDSFMTLKVGGEDTVAAVLPIGDPLVLEVSGTPEVVFVLGYSPMRTVGAIVIPPIQIDLGGPIQIVLNGIAPVALIDLLGSTGDDGATSFSFPIGFQFPAGTLGAFQAIAVDPSSPMGVTDTAAAEVELIDTLSISRVNYLRGSSAGATGFFSDLPGGSPQAIAGLSTSIDIESIFLNSFTSFVAQNQQSVYASQDPAIVGPQTIAANTSFNHISTIHGDLYHFQDIAATPDVYGFMMVPHDGSDPYVIPDSTMPNNSSGTSWESAVTISDDQNTAVVVLDQSGGVPDRIFLMKLDGFIFPTTLSPMREITPLSSPTIIEETSVRMVSDHVYFVDNPIAGTLYSSLTDNSLYPRATPVAIPVTGTGTAVTLVEDELYRAPGQDLLIIQAGATTTNEDIYAVTHPGGVQTVVNASNFPTNSFLEQFGDDNSGSDGHIAVSPDGSRVAFVKKILGRDELYVARTNGSTTPVHLTDDTVFAPSIGHTIDLRFNGNFDLTAFVGTSTTFCDLYSFNLIPTIFSPITNITETNGQDGNTLPISATPRAEIRPRGQVDIPGGILFARDGLQVYGASAGTTTAYNLVGVNMTTLQAYDILGDEFSGGPAQVGIGTSTLDFDLQFTDSGRAWFKTRLGTDFSNSYELFTINLFTETQATNVTQQGGAGIVIDNITPYVGGDQCLFSFSFGGGSDGEFVGSTELPYPGALLYLATEFPGSDITDGSIRPVENGSEVGFLYSSGSNSTANPTNAILKSFNITTVTDLVLDDELDAYHILNISLP